MKPARIVTVLAAVLCANLMVVTVAGAKKAHARTAMEPDWCLLNVMGWTMIENRPCNLPVCSLCRFYFSTGTYYVLGWPSCWSGYLCRRCAERMLH